MGEPLLKPTAYENTPVEVKKNLKVDISTPTKQVELCRKMMPFISGLADKISNCYSGTSQLNLPQNRALMVSGENDWNIIFRCGAYFLLEVPKELINGISKNSTIMLDFLIKDWVFTFNDKEIPVDVWCSNPVLNSPKLLQSVPEKTARALDKKENFLITKLHEYRSTLLPKTYWVEQVNNTDNHIPKLNQVEVIKFPKLKITKRNTN